MRAEEVAELLAKLFQFYGGSTLSETERGEVLAVIRTALLVLTGLREQLAEHPR